MPMTEINALHTAARRFCIDLLTTLPPHLHVGGQRMPPRVLPIEYWAYVWLFDAVLLDIEATVPDDFATTDALREYLSPSRTHRTNHCNAARGSRPGGTRGNAGTT